MTVTTGSADAAPLTVAPAAVAPTPEAAAVVPTPAPAGDATVSTQPAGAVAPFSVVAPPPARPGLLDRARTEGVTGPAVVAMSAVVVGLGALLDLRRDATLGLGTGLACALVALAAPAVVRFRSLLTAAVLPPLLVAAAAAGLARFGGQNRGSREVVLDVGTTLALSAPLLFGVTALGVLVVLVRLARRLVTR